MAKLKMKLDFKKFNAKWFKEFALNKGEKVVLGLVVAIGLLLVVRGMLDASGASYSDKGTKLIVDLQNGKKNYEQTVNGAPVPPVVPIETKKPWEDKKTDLPNFKDYVAVTESVDRTRGVPKVLPIFDNNIRLDYFKAGLEAFEINIENKKATIVIKTGEDKKTAKLAHTILPKRMVIVSALFPVKEQLEEFVNALKLRQNLAVNGNADDDKPQLLGFSVYKIEKDEKGKMAETPFIVYDSATEKYVIADNLDDAYRRSVTDPDGLKPFGNHHLFPGLMTIPFKLASATAEYPLPVLPGFSPVKPETTSENKTKTDDDDDETPKNKPPKGVKPMNAPVNPIVQRKVPKAGPGEKQKADDVFARIDTVPFGKWGAKEHTPQFEGDYAFLDGQTAGGEDQKDGKGKDPMPRPFVQPDKMPKGPKPMGRGPLGGKGAKDVKEEEPVIVDPLIRFIDVDVKPGYSYAYKIQVRLKNPNYNNPDVAVLEQKEIKEIVSPWTTTRFIKIPTDEAYVYVYDQHYIEEEKKEDDDSKGKKEPMNPMNIKGPKGGKGFGPKKKDDKEKEKEKEVKKGPQPRGPDFAKADADRCPIQIHRWVDWTDRANQRGVVGDWIIAERLLVRRGEYVGRPRVIVEVPTWSMQKSDFEMINTQPFDDTHKKGGPPKATGIPLDFSMGKTPPVVVDFDGGQRKIRGGYFEETPTELLLVNGDGTLALQNSYDDGNNAERVERYEAYRERLKTYARPEPVEEEPKEKGKDKRPKGGILK